MRYIFLSLLLIGCASQLKPTSVPVTEGACAAAQHNLQVLHCDNGRGGHLGDSTLRGKSWEQLCLDDAADGIDLQPICISKAKNCTGVNSCVQ